MYLSFPGGVYEVHVLAVAGLQPSQADIALLQRNIEAKGKGQNLCIPWSRKLNIGF